MHTNQLPISKVHLGIREYSRPERDKQTFADLLPGIRAWDAEFSEIEPVSVDCVSVAEGQVIFDRNSAPFDHEAHLRLLAKAGAPVTYLARRSLDFQILALREHIEGGGR